MILQKSLWYADLVLNFFFFINVKNNCSVLETIILFPVFFYKMEIRCNIINVLLSLLINWMFPCWIKILKVFFFFLNWPPNFEMVLTAEHKIQGAVGSRSNCSHLTYTKPVSAPWSLNAPIPTPKPTHLHPLDVDPTAPPGSLFCSEGLLQTFEQCINKQCFIVLFLFFYKFKFARKSKESIYYMQVI